jgi:hypothetical protein
MTVIGQLVAERNALRQQLAAAETARARLADAVRGVRLLASGSNAETVVPCFDRYDYDAMQGVGYVVVRAAEWRRIEAALAATEEMAE